jgi:hypothetical protein
MFFKPKPKHRFANANQPAPTKKYSKTSDSRKAGCGHCGGKKKKEYKQEQ